MPGSRRAQGHLHGGPPAAAAPRTGPHTDPPPAWDAAFQLISRPVRLSHRPVHSLKAGATVLPRAQPLHERRVPEASPDRLVKQPTLTASAPEVCQAQSIC